MKSRALLPALLFLTVTTAVPRMPTQAHPLAPTAVQPATERAAAAPLVAEAPHQASTDPLAPFERLIGGQWHLEGSYHEFEWGLGRQSVTTRSYWIVEGTPKLVSYGVWFWHPGEKAIKGVFTATDMPVVFFDYTVRFEDDRMVCDLAAFDADGNETAYVETWEFTDDNHYVWKLLSETPDGLQEVMGGTFERKD